MKFALNPAGVDQVVGSSGVVGHLERVGSEVVRSVESHAPTHTGDFAGSITKTGVKPDRRGLRLIVYSTDWAAHLVEFGSANNPAYSPFRRAASSLGLRLRGGGDRP